MYTFKYSASEGLYKIYDDKGFGSGIANTEEEAKEVIAKKNSAKTKTWYQKAPVIVKHTERMYGNSSEYPHGNDSNEQGEP